MRARRPPVLPFLALALAAAAARAAQKPRDYRHDLRQAQSHQQRRRYRDCIQACDKMLEYHKEAWQAKEITWLKIENLILDTQYEAASTTLAALAKAHAADRKLQTAVALRTGDVRRLLKKPDEAVAAYRKLAAGAAKGEPEQAAEALLRAAEVLCADLKKPQEGIALYREIEAAFGAQAPKQAARALRAAAVAHETQTKDLPKAAAAYRALTDKYAAVYDPRTLAGLYAKAADCYTSAQQPAEAVAVATKAEAALDDEAQKASFGVRHGDGLAAMKKFAEARAQYQRVLCSYPLEQSSCQQAQARIVETHRAESQWAAALGAARILFDAAGDERSIRDAAQVVARAFLAADGGLARANGFLAYQRFGPSGPDGKPNTPDDVAANPLPTIRYPTLGAAASKQFQAAIAARPNTCDGYRAKAFLYIYQGKPKEGAAQFLLAFKAADVARVPAAAQELVLIGMKAHTASFRGLDRIFEYINHGPKGKSGKENIPDPFAGL